MEFVSPQVILLAETSLDQTGLDDFLSLLNATDFQFQKEKPAETLIEVAGRACYKSFVPKLNPNVNRIRQGNKNYIKNILDQRHGSVLEHASVTLAFLNVSRIVTHELVRHRSGMAYSQESLRFVRFNDLKMYYPEAFEVPFLSHLQAALEKIGVMFGPEKAPNWAYEKAEYLFHIFKATSDTLESIQREIASQLMLDRLPEDFHIKKTITSAIRRLAPEGLATNLIATGNHRAWRHIIQTRTAPGAEEEIRLIFNSVAETLSFHYPAIYQDMIEEKQPFGPPAISFKNEKV